MRRAPSPPAGWRTSPTTGAPQTWRRGWWRTRSPWRRSRRHVRRNRPSCCPPTAWTAPSAYGGSTRSRSKSCRATCTASSTRATRTLCTTRTSCAAARCTCCTTGTAEWRHRTSMAPRRSSARRSTTGSSLARRRRCASCRTTSRGTSSRCSRGRWWCGTGASRRRGKTRGMPMGWRSSRSRGWTPRRCGRCKCASSVLRSTRPTASCCSGRGR
mmetsp:Transcript_5811/g.14259  ORF Transcript_5811/g.14259 Transcript_5811/m.14259 type:complete len:214 (-) Transcript_5811:146-787(-)